MASLKRDVKELGLHMLHDTDMVHTDKEFKREDFPPSFLSKINISQNLTSVGFKTNLDTNSNSDLCLKEL